MYYFEIGKLKYSYLVGPHTVGIITPSRKKYLVPIVQIHVVAQEASVGEIVSPNGTADCRITATEIAAYVLDGKLL